MHDAEELELRDYLRILRRRFKTIVLVAVVAVIVSGILSFLVIKPTYQAQATLVVVNKSTPVADYNTFTLDEQLVQTYATLGTSYGVVQGAIQTHGLSFTEQQLSKLLTVSAVTNTDLVTVAAKGKTPSEASTLANDVAASLTHKARSVTPGYYVTVVDSAVPPQFPVSPNKKLNLILALVLGLLVGLGLAFMQEYFDRTIHDPEQLEREMGIPVLAAVPIIDQTDIKLTRPQSIERRKRMRA